jgi:hypothetical protein
MHHLSSARAGTTCRVDGAGAILEGVPLCREPRPIAKVEKRAIAPQSDLLGEDRRV